MKRLDTERPVRPLQTVPSRSTPRSAVSTARRLRGMASFSVRLLDTDLLGRWVSEPAPAYTAVLSLRAGAAGFELLMDDLALTPELAPDIMGGLTDASRLVCVSYVLAAWFEQLEGLLGRTVSLTGLAYRRVLEVPGESLFFELEEGATGVRRQGCLVPEDAVAWTLLEQLTGHLSESVLPESQDDDAVSVRFVLGSSRVTRAQTEALRPGWVILLQTLRAGQRGFGVVSTDGTDLARFAIERGSARAHRIGEEHEVKVALVDEVDVEQQTLDEVKVEMGFEIGGALVSLAELRAMAPGDVLELARPIEECSVRIRCGERVVGSGELVDLDGVLGVRIVTLNGRD